MTTYLDSGASFGAYMRAERQRKGWSLTTAQNKTGIPAVVIGSYERNDRQATIARAINFVESYGLRLAVIGPGDVVVRGDSDESRVDWLVVYGERGDGLIACGSQQEAEHIWEYMPGSKVAFRTHVFGELTFAGEES